MYTSFSATMTVNIGGHETLGTLLETVVSFSVTIGSKCESTTFFDNISIRDQLTYVGDQPLVWRFDEWPDTVSASVADFMPPINPFCEDR